MENKKIKCTCPTCEELISTKPQHIVACCSRCKRWYHAICQNAKEEDLNKKQWHCSDCIKTNKEKKPNMF